MYVTAATSPEMPRIANGQADHPPGASVEKVDQKGRPITQSRNREDALQLQRHHPKLPCHNS